MIYLKNNQTQIRNKNKSKTRKAERNRNKRKIKDPNPRTLNNQKDLPKVLANKKRAKTILTHDQLLIKQQFKI